jgi:energy-coupling factor transporter ATP-binding protein EcfA2
VPSRRASPRSSPASSDAIPPTRSVAPGSTSFESICPFHPHQSDGKSGEAHFTGSGTRSLESFEFTQGEIEDAVAIARGLTLLAPPVEDDRKVSQAADLLAEACRRQAARRPISFAQRLPPRMTPADLAADPKHVLRRRVILPAATGLQLNELLDRMTNLSRVYRDLAFEQRLSLGRGLLVLFTGPPGTGKTLAATTLAGLLRKDLYRVDTAAVASRFVGETEKNLGRLFADVQNANAILFFDEADALFGKRGEVVQAADRWANMQISFLLQRVEEYTGTVILASNARESIDSAFFRRFQVMIDFPRPDPAGRLAILEGMVAGTAVAVADANGRVATTPEEIRAVLKPVAERFDLTGGNLKNVLLDATFRAVSAAADGTPVLTTRDLILGVAREYQKDGKSVSVATFGKDWFAVVEREMKLARGS